MKNLFKNLMLVAVAAMGFTACEQVIDDVNATNETFTVNIVGEFADDTRSGFLEKAEGATAYKSAWDGDETAVFSLDEAALVPATNAYTGGGNKASFAPEFTKSGSTIYAFSPKGVYDKDNASKRKGGVTGIIANEDYAYVVVPAEQTTSANSVDRAVHILAGKADFAENVNMTFNHVVAYGKMTINNFGGNIDKVEITASEYLAGISCKYYYNEGKLDNANVNTITVNNPDEAKDNKVFWFGCAPADLSNGTLTVKIYSGEDTYTKELDITGKTDKNGEKIEFQFQQGRVASFSVSMEGIEADVKEPAPSTVIENGNYVIAGYKDGKYYALPNANKTTSGTIAHSVITVTDGKVSVNDAVGYIWTVAAAEGGYTFFNGEHYLVAAETSGAKLKTQTDAVAWALGESGDYGYKFISPKADDRYLSCRINTSYNVFGAYKNYGDGEYLGVHLLPIDGVIKTALAAPVPTTTVDGNTITIEWNAVDGAKDYTITMVGRTPETITATSKIFSGLDYDTNYQFTIVANPEDVDTYASSSPVNVEARTGVDPNATETIDVIDIGFIGIESYSSYTSWSDKTGISGAVYAGNSHKNNNAIQLRVTDNNSGIVTTTSGGKIKKVVVKWASNTAVGRILNVYGKNSAYLAASDLYTDNKGAEIGTIECGTSTELTVEGNYAYIGIRSYYGAIYVESISIYWEPSNGEEPVLTKLSNPTDLEATKITDNSFTLSWTAVTNANHYEVTCGSQTKTVNTNTCEFTGLTAETSYNISVVAKGDGIEYLDSDAEEITVKTLAAEEPEQPSEGGAKTYTFTITKSDFNSTSYVANNNEKTTTATASDGTTMEVKWTSNQVMQQNSTMQWQKSKGCIYNSTDLGTINSVEIDDTAGTFTTYINSSNQPTSNGTGGYFQIKVGGATGKVNSIKVTFTK